MQHHLSFLHDPNMGRFRRFREMIAFLHLGVNPEIQWEKISIEVINHKKSQEQFIDMMHWFILKTQFDWAFAQNGILGTDGFWSELNKRFGSKLLPPVYKPNSLDDVLSKVVTNKDFKVIKTILEFGNLPELFRRIQFFDKLTPEIRKKLRSEIRDALIILSTRLASEGLLPEVVEKLKFENEMTSPMVQLQHRLQHYLEPEFPDEKLYIDVWESIADTELTLKQLRRHRDQFGVSLRMAFTLKRMDLELERIRKLIVIHFQPESEDADAGIFQIFKELLKHEFEKKHIRPMLEDTLNVLAYKVVEQTSRKGENFIAVGRKAWFAMWRAALGGGCIVSLMVITKTLLHFLHAPPLIEAILFSLNYGIGFTIVQLLGFTIATKQPSMTASTLAGSLRVGTSLENIKQDFTKLVKRISSTQFVALLGNLMVVGPMAYGWAWIWQETTGSTLLTQKEATETLLKNHPWQSGLIFYAVLTGIFLMLSGLTAGFVENKKNYDRLPARIQNSIAVKQIIGLRGAVWWSKYIDHNLGSLAGNFSLGFFLGTASFVGLIVGLPIDIRHVTFVFGNIGVAFQSLGNIWPNGWHGWEFLLGVILTAITNVVFSFGLSLWIAVRSRGIKFGETPGLFRYVFITFLKQPWSFFFPRK
jgi:site-specific recombinase